MNDKSALHKSDFDLYCQTFWIIPDNFTVLKEYLSQKQ